MLKNLQNRLNDNKGFSLVELIVVIAIMVILIALLVPNVIGYISKAQDSANLSAAKTIYNAANTAVIDCKASLGAYPSATQLANVLNGKKANGSGTATASMKLAVVPKGTAAGIDYDAATGSIKTVWVSSSTGAIANSDKNLQAYDPLNPGNAAVDSTGAAKTLPGFEVTNPGSNTEWVVGTSTPSTP